MNNCIHMLYIMYTMNLKLDYTIFFYAYAILNKVSRDIYHLFK